MIRKISSFIAMLILAFSLTGCFQRVDEGKIGIVIAGNGAVSQQEVIGWNHTFFRTILEANVRETLLSVEDKKYTVKGDIPLGDFDFDVAYTVNASAASELYRNQNRAFHLVEGNDLWLMHRRIATMANNAAYKAVRAYDSSEISDRRVQLEAAIADDLRDQLRQDKLENSITVGRVIIRAITPNSDILNAAKQEQIQTKLADAKRKEVEVAKLEAERIAALSKNRDAIEYMNAQATLNFSNAALNGKVTTLIIPHGMNILPPAK